MTEPPRYWTRPFMDGLVAALNADPRFQKAARSFSNAIILRCTGTPEGKDVAATYRIDRGRVVGAWREEESPCPALREEPFDPGTALARTTAPYALWCRLDRGEMNVLQAIASPDYRLEGPKLRVLANLRMLDAMSAVASRLPKRY